MTASTHVVFLLSLLFGRAAAFTSPSSAPQTTRIVRQQQSSSPEATTPTTAENVVIDDPKEAVKLFGRLAEKYIMLDETAGLCCYSACADCEYRLPDGGYRMADQSAARPKWIPSYVSRTINGKEHTTKWSSELYNGEDGETALDRSTFCQRLVKLAYAPPLGGPYVSASGATVEDWTAAQMLFDVLADGKEKLTKARMSMRFKQLAGGDEGMTWPKFQQALGL